MMETKWLEWGRALQIVAQNGLAYANNPFDVERYEEIRRIALEILAAHTGQEVERLETLFSGEVGYATPKVDVRGAVFQDDRILLVRELGDNGRWTLPGGWADNFDSPGEAVAREIREETGYEARPVKLVAVYDRSRRGHPPHHFPGHPNHYFSTYKLFFHCELTGGAPASSVETGEASFFPEDRLPELSLSRVTLAEIHTLFEHYRRPELPTEFD